METLFEQFSVVRWVSQFYQAFYNYVWPTRLDFFSKQVWRFSFDVWFTFNFQSVPSQ